MNVLDIEPSEEDFATVNDPEYDDEFEGASDD